MIQTPIMQSGGRHSLAPVRNRLSTAAVPHSQRFNYWLDMICAVYVQLDSDRPECSDVFGDIEFGRIGGIDFTMLCSNAPHLRRTASLIRGTTESYYLVQLQRQGRGVVSQDGRIAIVEPGDFVIYDTTRPYELIYDCPQHEVTVMRLPQAQLEQHVGGLDGLTATTVHGQSAAAGLLQSMAGTLQRELDQLHPSSVLEVGDAITHVIAAGLRSLPRANQRRPSTLYAYHLARIKDYVRKNLRDPELSTSSVARAMGISPDHVARLFRHEPMPLSRLIWQQRLDACRRDLADPRLAERSISEIAFSWGFNEAAHFSRSFKEQFGSTPREWRARALRPH